MTTTETEAFEAMRAHHRSLTDGVDRRARALADAVTAGAPYEPPAAQLVAYLAEEVLPHAWAEEQTIYRAAGQYADLAGTVQEMTAEHRRLADLSEKLARASESQEALVAAGTIGPLFAAHVDKEDQLLLPRLHDDPATQLPDLLRQMHELLEGAKEAPGEAGPAPVADSSAPAPDPLGAVFGLLLDAGKALAGSGQGDLACRLVASAWAAVRGPRPELAVRATAALHGLARAATSQPVSFSGASGAAAAPADPTLDVRQMAPAKRHEVIFATFASLPPSTGFVLVNDHDPRPLRYQFEAEHAGQFTWDYLEAGPEVWRVRIGRPAAVGASGASGAAAAPADPTLDVRQMAPAKRHEVIFATFASLPPSTGFVLVNDHDPRPLRYQFEAEHAGQFTWDYLEAGPEVWRVRIGRPAAVGATK